MNGRISLALLATYLATKSGFTTTKIGTCYDRDYLTSFAKVWPAVWIAGQRLIPTDDGRGLTDEYRQHCRVDVAVKLVIQRYKDGSIDAEARMNALHDSVAAAFAGYTPAGADQPFVWSSAADGEYNESVLTADLVFSTTVTYMRAAA